MEKKDTTIVIFEYGIINKYDSIDSLNNVFNYKERVSASLGIVDPPCQGRNLPRLIMHSFLYLLLV